MMEHILYGDILLRFPYVDIYGLSYINVDAKTITYKNHERFYL